MLKTTILGAVAFTAITSAAFAADLPTMKGPPPFVPPPAFSWTGFYIGGNIGYGWGDDRDSQFLEPSALAFGADPFRVSDQPSGVIGGGQVGYNWQTGSFVFGVEADIDAADINGRHTLNGLPDITGTIVPAWFSTAREDVEVFGTARGRIGYAAFDRTLIYATGGLAYGEVKYSNYTQFSPASVFEYSGSAEPWQVGWTVGGGIEYAITNNWTIKGEYLYYDLGSEKYLAQPLAANPPFAIGQKFETTGDIVRAGFNYKF